MIKAAILADSSTDFVPLVDMLMNHPDVEITNISHPSLAGLRLDSAIPHLIGDTDMRFTAEPELDKADILFMAVAPESSRNFIKRTNLPDDIRLIDISGDYRLPDDTHDFVNGIAELNRKTMVRGARHVAVPDPRSLAIALALLPLAKNLMLTSDITARVCTSHPKALSGVSTASVLEKNVADELTNAFSSLQTSFGSAITGTSISGGLDCGLSAVCTLQCSVDVQTLADIYNEYYDDHNFTFLVDKVPLPAHVRGTNKCFVYLERKDNKLIVTSVLDPIIKGTWGNAIHAMNLLFGLHERVGLQ